MRGFSVVAIGMLAMMFLRSGAGQSVGPWYVRHPHPTAFATDIVHDGEKFVLSGDGGIFTSVSKENWARQQVPFTERLNSLVLSSNRFVAAGVEGGIMASEDATNWVALASPTTNQLRTIRGGTNGFGFIAVGYNGTIVRSADGTNFVQDVSGTTNDFLDLVIGPDRAIAVGANATIVVSTNAGKWHLATTPFTTNHFRSVVYHGGEYLVAGAVSTNGFEWSARAPNNAWQVGVMASKGNQLIRAVPNNRYEYSGNGGRSWSQTSLFQGLFARRLVVIDGVMHFMGTRVAHETPTGLGWNYISVSLLGPSQDYFTNIASGPSGYVVSTSTGRKFYSRDAQAWEEGVGDPPVDLTDRDYLTPPFARAQNGAVRVSDDGVEWVSPAKQPTNNIFAAARLGSTIVAAHPHALWTSQDAGASWASVVSGRGPRQAEGGSADVGPFDDRLLMALHGANGWFGATTLWGELYLSRDGLVWEKYFTGGDRELTITPHSVLTITLTGIFEAFFLPHTETAVEARFTIEDDQIHYHAPLGNHVIETSSTLEPGSWEVLRHTHTNLSLPIGSEARYFRALRNY